MICCETNIANLEYRLSPNAKWTVINLKGAKHCVDVEDIIGGWAEIYTARYQPDCTLVSGQEFLNDLDPSSIYTYQNTNRGNAPNCPGTVQEYAVYRNGSFLKYAHDTTSLRYEYFKPSCSLKLFVNGKEISTIAKVNKDRGSICPIEYRLNCRECPQGYLRCDCTEYPGYCCLPCEPIAAEIKSIKNNVKTLNKTEVSRG